MQFNAALKAAATTIAIYEALHLLPNTVAWVAVKLNSFALKLCLAAKAAVVDVVDKTAFVEYELLLHVI